MQKEGSLETFEASSCWGKIRHQNRGRAFESIRRTQKRKNLRGSKKAPKQGLAPYFCKFCGGWHIGHS